MILLLINLIQVTATVLSLIILIDVVLSFFVSPFHPVRQTMDVIVEPMLAPIRRLMPATGAFDFSPIILLILIQLLESVLIQILLSMG